MSHRFRAVVFDLDGTLVETAPDLCRAANHALAEVGRPPLSVPQVRSMIGDGARALLLRGLEATGGEELPPEALQRLLERMLDFYGRHIADESRPFPGVVPVLEDLRTAGVRLGVCTNKPAALTQSLLAQLDLARLFDTVVGGDTLAVRKPHPGHVTGTIAQLGVPAWRSAMVGDSRNDLAAARAAGLPVVLVSFGYTDVPAADLGADALIDRFADLPEALAQLS